MLWKVVERRKKEREQMEMFKFLLKIPFVLFWMEIERHKELEILFPHTSNEGSRLLHGMLGNAAMTTTNK